MNPHFPPSFSTLLSKPFTLLRFQSRSGIPLFFMKNSKIFKKIFIFESFHGLFADRSFFPKPLNTWMKIGNASEEKREQVCYWILRIVPYDSIVSSIKSQYSFTISFVFDIFRQMPHFIAWKEPLTWVVYRDSNVQRRKLLLEVLWRGRILYCTYTQFVDCFEPRNEIWIEKYEVTVILLPVYIRYSFVFN